MAKDLASLPSYVGSRSEEFLNYIAGRNTNLNSLPVPNSRIEEYLEFLCYNGTGSGGNNTNALTSVRISSDGNRYEFIDGSGVVRGTINFMTDQEVQNIKNLFN
ncbi:unknown [Clostridium sp. CAG:221]|mgnify:FL=1|jgi:hypothetical protein|uniref:hypothetical protein n=1 Tax=Clostridium sp. CAG:221 TaxID=1262780 RepID=UPI00033A1823|nr:hypothetical protein [Clostridium sp. CAG:221]CDB16189.1 unknown [Clostridium sp. CAG:221]